MTGTSTREPGLRRRPREQSEWAIQNVATITRPAQEQSASPPAAPGEQAARQARVTAPPAPPTRPRRPPQPRRPLRSRPEEPAERGKNNKHHMPFFLLLCVLLGGALVCALVISTTLAEGSFQITRLQQSNDALARQRQMLQEQVAAAQSAQMIQQRALKLGMRPAGELRFLNLKTGKVQTDAGSGALAAIDVPGYTP